MNATIEREVIGIGHNQAPLAEMLAASYRDLLAEISEAVASASRAPKVISDDETSGKFADLVDDLRNLKKQIVTAHDAEKSPFLEAGRIVDDFTRTPTAELDSSIKALLATQTTYLDAKDKAARAEAKRIADEAAEAAEAKLREAERLQDKGDFDGATTVLEQAAQADEAAVAAAQTAQSKPADLTRIYSRGGSVTSLRKEWTGEIIDADKLDAAKLWGYIALAEKQKALRAFVKAGGRELAGARIFEQSKAR